MEVDTDWDSSEPMVILWQQSDESNAILANCCGSPWLLIKSDLYGYMARMQAHVDSVHQGRKWVWKSAWR
jgi:hypothetical protein